MDFFDFFKNYRFVILATSIFLNILLIGSSGFLLYKYLNYECAFEVAEVSNKTDQIIPEVVKEKFYVEIKGAVKNPGVYEASNQNIINDIVNLAGGFTKKAYTKNINLSRKVTDELVIFVFTESEYKKDSKKVEQSSCECSTYEISNCTENLISEIVSSDKDTTFVDIPSDEENNISLININTASKEELMNLSGIGESKAEDIIAYRTTNGNFKTIEEIKNVSGIGDALFAKIKDSITV